MCRCQSPLKSTDGLRNMARVQSSTRRSPSRTCAHAYKILDANCQARDGGCRRFVSSGQPTTPETLKPAAPGPQPVAEAVSRFRGAESRA